MTHPNKSKPIEYVDPVCYMKVNDKNKAHKYTFDFRTYYFCAEACHKAFIVDPEKYLDPKPTKRKGWWGRYLDRLNKVTGGKPPQCH